MKTDLISVVEDMKRDVARFQDKYNELDKEINPSKIDLDRAIEIQDEQNILSGKIELLKGYIARLEDDKTGDKVNG